MSCADKKTHHGTSIPVFPLLHQCTRCLETGGLHARQKAPLPYMEEGLHVLDTTRIPFLSFTPFLKSRHLKLAISATCKGELIEMHKYNIVVVILLGHSDFNVGNEAKYKIVPLIAHSMNPCRLKMITKMRAGSILSERQK